MELNNTKDFLYKVQKDKNNLIAMKSPLLENRKNILDLKILVGVDVSGSITSEQYVSFMKQLDLIKGLSVVKVIEIDSQIVAMYDYFKLKNRIVRLGGGGGTEFSPFFNMAKKINADCLLVMTDGEVFNQINNPNIPTGWILTKDGKKPYDWGEEIKRI